MTPQKGPGADRTAAWSHRFNTSLLSRLQKERRYQTIKSPLFLLWLPPLQERVETELYENPWILGPCTQQTSSCPFKAYWALVPCFFSCNVKYPSFLIWKTIVALHTFLPGLAINKGAFPGRQFVSLPSHPEWSVHLYSQHGPLWHSTLRKHPEQFCLGLTSDREPVPHGKLQCRTDTTLEQDNFCFLPPYNRSFLC